MVCKCHHTEGQVATGDIVLGYGVVKVLCQLLYCHTQLVETGALIAATDQDLGLQVMGAVDGQIQGREIQDRVHGCREFITVSRKSQ